MLSEHSRAILRVYDVCGSLVKVIEDRVRPPGRYEVRWNGDDEKGERVPSGLYFYRLRAGETELARKMVLLK